MRKQFIISQTRAGRTVGRQRAEAIRRVHRPQSLAPIGPAFLRLKRPIDPFGQVWRACQRRFDPPSNQPLRHPRRQRINRFKGWQTARFFKAQYMVRVNHLADAVKKLDLARHHAPLPRGQQLAQIGVAGVKEHQLKFHLRIAHVDAVGAALLARGQVQAHLNLDRDRRRGYHIAD